MSVPIMQARLGEYGSGKAEAKMLYINVRGTGTTATALIATRTQYEI